MHLKRLFIENHIKDPNDIIKVLNTNTNKWVIGLSPVDKESGTNGTIPRGLFISDSANKLQGIIETLRYHNVKKVFPKNMFMSLNIDRSYGSGGSWKNPDPNKHFEVLHQYFHPDLDKPKPPPLEGFHDEDDFNNNEPELLGYEFAIGGISSAIEARASLYDISALIKLPPEVKTWMENHYQKHLNIINKQLML